MPLANGDQGHPARPHDRRRSRRPAGFVPRATSRPTRSSRRASTCGSARSPIACARASCPGRSTTVAERIDELQAARDRADRRRGAGDRLRLHRAAARKPRAAGRHRRRRQSEKLDRPARRVHPRDRRRDARLRPHRGRLSRPALCRDQPEDLSGAGARRLAAVADPLPPRPRACSTPPRCARCTRASGWSTTPTPMSATASRSASISPGSGPTASSATAPSATPA